VLIQEREALEQTIGCYFHQDWPDDFASETEAFVTIRSEVPEDEIGLAIRGLESLLSGALTDEELSRALREEYGCYVNPAYRGLSSRQWLAEARDALAAGQ
jgi:hypothetical protein